MIEMLLSLPGWVLSLAAGLVCAALGLAVVRLVNLRGDWLRYLPLALAAVGYAATDRFVLPELMRSDVAYCAIANATADQTTERRAGITPDPVTTFVATTADCAEKTIVARYAVNAARADVDPGGLAVVEQAFTADTCGDPQLRRMIAAGWRVENHYAFSSGAPLVMTAAC
jgi:hypothetical protein